MRSSTSAETALPFTVSEILDTPITLPMVALELFQLERGAGNFATRNFVALRNRGRDSARFFRVTEGIKAWPWPRAKAPIAAITRPSAEARPGRVMRA